MDDCLDKLAETGVEARAEAGVMVNQGVSFMNLDQLYSYLMVIVGLSLIFRG